MGHSAGAQIATLLALDPEYLRAAGLTPERDVCGVIGLAGLYDFLPAASAEVKAVFGPEEAWPRSQPINYVTRESGVCIEFWLRRRGGRPAFCWCPVVRRRIW